MEQFSLTVARVVEADRLALAEGRLTAMIPGNEKRFPGDYIAGRCVYVYGNPAKNIGCAIGVALPLSLKIGAESMSNRTLDTDLLVEWNAPPDNRERSLLRATQVVHDWWAGKNNVPVKIGEEWNDLPVWAKNWFFSHRTEKVTRELFEAWLSLVESNYLKA